MTSVTLQPSGLGYWRRPTWSWTTTLFLASDPLPTERARFPFLPSLLTISWCALLLYEVGSCRSTCNLASLCQASYPTMSLVRVLHAYSSRLDARLASALMIFDRRLSQGRIRCSSSSKAATPPSSLPRYFMELKFIRSFRSVYIAQKMTRSFSQIHPSPAQV